MRAILYACVATLTVGCTSELESFEGEAPSTPETFSTSSAAVNGNNVAGSNLGGSNLSGSNVNGANIGGANLGGTNVNGANVAGANVGGTNLGGNNVGGNNIAGTNVGGTNLGGTNVGGTNVSGNNVAGSNLGGSNVAGANISGTNVSGTNLATATLATANVGKNIHNLAAANKLLESGEDLWTSRTSACVVLGVGSTAFAKIVAANPSGNMYAAIKKLPWGFTASSGGAVTLQAWEAVVWGSSKYCVFLVMAPPDATFTGVAGYLKAIWRWNAPTTRTMSIGQIGGGETVQNHTGMMDAAAKVTAGAITPRAYVAGGLMFAAATTNDVSVQVDFAAWVANENSNYDGLILGRPEGTPVRMDAVYRAVSLPDGNVLPVISQRPDNSYGARDSYYDLAPYGYAPTSTRGRALPKRCYGALVLNRAAPSTYPSPTTKCDAFAIQVFADNAVGLGQGALPAMGGLKWNYDVLQLESGLTYDSPNGVSDYYQLIPPGKYGCTTSSPTYDAAFQKCRYPVLSETYVHLNEIPFSVSGAGGFVKINGPYAYKNYQDSDVNLSVTVTNVGTVAADNWRLTLSGLSYPVPAYHTIHGLAPGASTTVSFAATAFSASLNATIAAVTLDSKNGERLGVEAKSVYFNSYILDQSAWTFSRLQWTTVPQGGVLRWPSDFSEETVTNGATASFDFVGIGFSLFGSTGPTYGTFTVRVDNGAPVTATANLGTAQDGALLYRLEGLAPGPHTVMVTKTGGTTMRVDYAVLAQFTW